MNSSVEHLKVRANGIAFHVAAAGPPDAPPILLLHGFPEGWMGWRELMEQLTEFRTYAPDLRGYPGTERPASGYDVFTLSSDVKALIEELGLERPALVSHDWGGAIAWIFAHRYSELIRKLVVVNCTHPKTLVRAVYRFEDWQTFRIPWVPFFEIPWLPEFLLTTSLGRKALRWSFLVREGQKGTMNRSVVDELVNRFQTPADFRPPIAYYREMVRTQLFSKPMLERLEAIYAQPITVPTTVIWGLKDGALSIKVAANSGQDAGCDIDWRPLPGVGHFVDLEASAKLAAELRAVLA